MKMRSENKGFSLVELIVVMAIFAVVGVVVGGFLTVTNRTYAVSANELDIQEEAQLVANQLQEMFLDTALGISYQYLVMDADSNPVIDYMTSDDAALPAGDLTSKDVYIYYSDHYYHLRWDKEKRELYLTEYRDESGTGYAPADGMTEDGVLLGEFISDFSVDISKVAISRMVHFEITFAKNDKTDRDYTVKRDISLRNNVLVNKPKEDVYDAAGQEISPAADALIVEPASVFMWPGDDLQYTYTLTCSRGGVPNQNIAWTFAVDDADKMDGNTKITSSGLAQIGVNEGNTRITATAKAKGYNYTEGTEVDLIKESTIHVRQIEGLSITKNDFENEAGVSAGGVYRIEVKMTGTNIDGVSVTEAGGITLILDAPTAVVSILNVTDIGNSTVRYEFKVSDTAPKGAKIGFTFVPTRVTYGEVKAVTPYYMVQNSDTEILKVSSESGDEWLRLGTAVTGVEFSESQFEDNYTNADGSLKTGFFIKYYYEAVNNVGMTVSKAMKTVNQTDTELTTYFTDKGGEAYKSKMQLSDQVFLTAGTVRVYAELCHSSNGVSTVVGSSNILEYNIPEATAGFSRSTEEINKTNLTAYITQKENDVPIYITFTSGFANGNYKLSLSEIGVSPAEYGAVAKDYCELEKHKIALLGSTDKADYTSNGNNSFTLKYGALPNYVTVKLMHSNVEGSDYYVPTDKEAWDDIGGNSIRHYYRYYIDDTHRMHIIYKKDSSGNQKFESAILQTYEQRTWDDKETYICSLSSDEWNKE